LNMGATCNCENDRSVANEVEFAPSPSNKSAIHMEIFTEKMETEMDPYEDKINQIW